MRKKEISHGDLHAALAETFKQRILDWQYPPGLRLLEEELCGEFGVSRSPVREALRTLLADGFVEQTPRKGFRVRQLDVKTAKELYEVRLALELYVIDRITAEPVPPALITELSALWNSGLKGSGTGAEDLAVLDRRFHERLALQTGNETLRQQLSSINDRIHVFRVIEFGRTETLKDTLVQHREVIAALKAGDAAAARKAIKENIELACNHVETTIKEALAKSFLKI